MNKPSKGATVFLSFFGLMFLVPGLLALFSFLANRNNASTSSVTVGAGIAVLISAIGGGLVFAAWAGYGMLKKQAALEESNPFSPWLWRADWANRRADSLKKNTQITAWLVCIFGNLVIIPVAANLAQQFGHANDPRMFIVLGVCAIGVILFVFALRSTLRHRRFGSTYFEFDSLPFFTGSHLTGRIHLQLDADAQHGIDLRLSCVRRTVTGTGNNRSTVQTVLWQADQIVQSGAMGTDPLGRTIPVDFAIPSDAYLTDHDNSSDQVLWLLHAQADVPGINYKDEFEVPVFKTSSVVDSAPADNSSEAFGFSNQSPSSSMDAGQVTPPENPKVVISSQDGGTEFYFRPFRSVARAAFLLIFTVTWSGVVYLLFRSNSPWFFALIFGFADLFLILAVFHTALGSERIRVGNGEIVSSKLVLGIGSTKRFPVSEIDSIVPVTGGQQGNGPGSTTYSIRLRTKNGKRITLADEIASRQEARWIVAQIESLAGLKIDTRIEVTAPFGAPPQPPQPGQTFDPSSQSPAARLAMARSRPQTSASVIASLVFFALVTGAMFAWQGWRLSHLKMVASAARARSARANAASNAIPARRVFATPMTDADVERVLALPAQDQAEELLERAIEHDQKALKLFNQQVESWVGHIRLTERMKQLERRSEYSSDLRVRYANADINLTLDGWQKSEQAADMLIERARTDQKYRAAAVYFLGMLAGRGVGYEKIHPVLLNYARHDPDAYVRQWAIEGMRYLGKDQALDELFESFTQDPSSNVRDRAGCNISDCGNFTRAQRMRMVPKFLALVSDPSTNPQMRSWSFMALREITDANVPPDAQAWNIWYGQHGAGKLAEFEKLDWWQVRGDE
ncbi:MAG TPA: HEAT repeat domain-containing protein [Candidatus Solibacter sp.]|nr:HEAT repeat domain-containing protein [Candidatus Solibacter sp.]